MARSFRRAKCISLALVLCSVGPMARAQSRAQSDEAPVSIVPRAARPGSPGDVPRADIRVDASLVLIPVHVTTAIGTTVTDLHKGDFRLFENGVEQNVSYFAQEDSPLSIGLVFDSSGSMQNKMRKVSQAAAAFLKTSNVQDEFFLIEFSERPKLAMPFTLDSDEIYKRIARTRPFGHTSLLDAIHLALTEMKNARNSRKAIVILSDGGDNRSRSTESEIKNAMLESDVQMHAMGIFDVAPDPKKTTPEERNGPRLLAELAEHSGGQLYRVDTPDDLPSISTRISEELRSQYLLGYFSTNDSRDGKYRPVKVSIESPRGSADLRSSYRHGYYAPAQ